MGSTIDYTNGYYVKFPNSHIFIFDFLNQVWKEVNNPHMFPIMMGIALKSKHSPEILISGGFNLTKFVSEPEDQDGSIFNFYVYNLVQQFNVNTLAIKSECFKCEDDWPHCAYPVTNHIEDVSRLLHKNDYGPNPCLESRYKCRTWRDPKNFGDVSSCNCLKCRNHE